MVAFFILNMLYDFTNTELIYQLENLYPAIKSEFNTYVNSQYYTEWPEKEIYNEGWNVFGLIFLGQKIEIAHQMCKITSAFLTRFPAITTAGFSILKPGCVIYPHKGYSNEVLRVHLGIDIPKGDCALKVGETTTGWTNGKTIIFNDTQIHEAWNKTSEPRIVMLLDVSRNYFLPV